MTAFGSEYLEWAKLHPQVRSPLTWSGVENLVLSELPVRLEELELTGPPGYGYAPLVRALAQQAGVDPDCVVTAAGASMANPLVVSGLVEPGDEILIQRPGLPPPGALARSHTATIRRFERRREDGFRVDVQAIERALSARTRLLVLTNLHNPSGVWTDQATLARVGELAGSVGARVLVDEVYLDAVLEPAAERSAIHLGGPFIVTSSLTKVYGLSGLRCGWILAPPELARRLWRLTDLYENGSAHIAQQLSVIALVNLARLRERTRALLTKNRPLLEAFLDARRDLDAVRPRHGTIVFPRLRTGGGDVDTLCDLLRARYQTAVVPGRFFEMPDHFRIGIGCASEQLSRGLEQLAAALDALAA